jgi:DNA topoisomerase-1
MEGRYGPYVTDGSVNASIPKGTDPASVTIEQANEWLEARAAAGPVKRGRRPRAMAAEKSVTRKAASRKRGLA